MVDVRRMGAGEAEALGRVMWDAIHNGPSLYTQAQRNAWLLAPPQGKAWEDKLTGPEVWVAQDGALLVGFVTLGEGGYVDLAFVAADAQGQGVFSALLAVLETYALAQSCPRLWTHASLMAEGAFAARGFHVIARETVERAGQMLARAKMEKVLT
ncbi:GNAT family N-acetyltransferase [uncultured Tateyamaria sp.]|uniref:GNAT family N-acetyltransferase n=1 Tax=uncultured Tateyamaria sp. TaxID=455651 RepID=UPI002632BB4F|nr:GNAT family N-acetyltransferase [uncultured Tateyamaria sp.]